VAGTNNTVVLRPGALGDAVVTLPVLESLRGAEPAARVLAVGSPAFRLAAECGQADEWAAFDDARLLGLFAEQGACELVADAELCIVYGRGDPLLRANLERSGVARVVAWPAQPAGGRHVVDHLLGAVEEAGWRAGTRVPRLVAQATWLEAATAWLAARGVRAEFAVVHPGSGGRAKRWAAEGFARVASRLPEPVVWVLGPAEAEDRALRTLGERVGVVADGLPLAALAGLLASCRVYVGNDSGVSHLAAAVGAPTVAVFGPTDPAVWAPRGERVVVVGGPERGGLDAVAAEEVLAAVGRARALSPSP